MSRYSSINVDEETQKEVEIVKEIFEKQYYSASFSRRSIIKIAVHKLYEELMKNNQINESED